MDDFYSLYMDDEPSAQQKAETMAAALRRQRAAGNLGLLTGDKVLGQFGKAQLDGASQGFEQLGGAGRFRSGQRLQQLLAQEAAKRAEANALRAREWNVQDDQTHRYQQMSDKASDREFNLQRDAINDEAAERRARIMAGQKMAQQERGTVVPGLEVDDGAAPTAEDAKKVKASQASLQRMRAYAQELGELHKLKGTELWGDAATRMEQLETQLQLEGKNIGELGALSGPDLGLMQSIIGTQPSSLKQNLKSFVGMDNTPAALKGLEKWAGDQEEAVMKSYGYRKPRSAKETLTKRTALPAPAPGKPNLDLMEEPAPLVAKPAPAAAGRKRVRNTKTGKTGWWSGQGALPAGVEVVNE